MQSIKQLEGKPFIFKVGTKVRNLGNVTGFQIDQKRTTVQVTVELTDEEAAGILGAAAHKEALGAPLTESEIEDIVEGDEWTGQVSA